MKTIVRSLLLAVTLLSAKEVQAVKFNDYYPMNPDKVTSVTLSNRSKVLTSWGSLICDVPSLKGVTTNIPPAFAEGGAAGFRLDARKGGFASGIPEYVGVTIFGNGGSATTTAVSLWLNGVDIGGEHYIYHSGSHGVWVDSDDRTYITLQFWTDQAGSLHLDFYVDDGPATINATAAAIAAATAAANAAASASSAAASAGAAAAAAAAASAAGDYAAVCYWAGIASAAAATAADAAAEASGAAATALSEASIADTQDAYDAANAASSSASAAADADAAAAAAAEVANSYL